MNAINHAATALIVNKKWPGVPIVSVLVSVQLVEFLWVVFNLLGIETTTTEQQVRALNDIHLAYMPYSHSITATAVLALLVWVVVAKLLKKPAWGLALAVAISSHIVLDLATHVHDIALVSKRGRIYFLVVVVGRVTLALTRPTALPRSKSSVIVKVH